MIDKMIVRDRKMLDRELTIKEIINILSIYFDETEKLHVINVIDQKDGKEKIGIFMDKEIMDMKKFGNNMDLYEEYCDILKIEK